MNPTIDRVELNTGTYVVTALDLCYKREGVKELMEMMKENSDKASLKCTLSGEDACCIYDCLNDFLHSIDDELRRR